MSRPRFLADNDLNESIIVGLNRREPGVQFVRAREVGLRAKSDRELLGYAAEAGLIVVSHDVNTMVADAVERVGRGVPMSGLLMVRQTAPIRPVIESLQLIWASSEAEEWSGVIAFLPL